MKKIKVGALNYDIEETIFPADEDVLGRYHPNKCLIEIEKRLAKDVKLQILFHELTHAICDMNNIEIKDDDVDRIATGILMVLKDNPNLEKKI